MATVASTGSRMRHLAFSAAAAIERAVSARSFSHSDLPTALALGEQEGVGHAAADDEHVDPGHEIAEEFELGRHLGAADDRDDRTRRIAERKRQRLELLLHARPA